MHSNLQSAFNSWHFPGMRAIYQSLFSIYREDNPLVISTVNKIWQNPNTNEPIDYIFIYKNSGSIEDNSIEHWHYVSLGLSDLYGDSRIHPINYLDLAGSDRISGLGFEFTIRIKKETDSPPAWPAQLMQQLAKYAFISRNKIMPNDYFPWNKPLNDNENCKLRHMLIALDCQLKKIKTVLGHVTFCQIVGVTDDELNVAQFNVKHVLENLKKDKITGGSFLVMDEHRTQTIFDIFPQALTQLKEELEREGSDLAGVDGIFEFREKVAIKTSLCLTMSDSGKSLDFSRLDIRTSAEQHLSSFLPFARHHIPLEGVEIIFSPSTAKFLELAFKYRLKKGHHFTFQNPDTNLTFVTENVSGSFVTPNQPYAINGKWLQIRIERDFLDKIVESLKDFDAETTQLPRIFDYPEKNLCFIVNHLTPTTNMIH